MKTCDVCGQSISKRAFGTCHDCRKWMSRVLDWVAARTVAAWSLEYRQ